MNAIGYVRLSQASDTSVERQREHIREYAEEHGFELVDIYSDGQRASGFDSEERGEYQLVVEEVRHGAIDAVIVNDKRRLTRDVDEAMRLIPDFRENGVELHTYEDGSLDLSDPIRAAIEIVSAAAAYEEKQQEIQKSKEAVQERLEEGYDHGPPRFGMEYSPDGKWQIPGEDYDKVRAVFEAREDGLSYPEIEDKVGVPVSTAHRIVENAEWYRERERIGEQYA